MKLSFDLIEILIIIIGITLPSFFKAYIVAGYYSYLPKMVTEKKAKF